MRMQFHAWKVFNNWIILIFHPHPSGEWILKLKVIGKDSKWVSVQFKYVLNKIYKLLLLFTFDIVHIYINLFQVLKYISNWILFYCRIVWKLLCRIYKLFHSRISKMAMDISVEMHSINNSGVSRFQGNMGGTW